MCHCATPTATSSSFDLSREVGEPLTGRHFTMTLFPVSQMEMEASAFDLKNSLTNFLIYGSYPEVLLEEDLTKKSHNVSLCDTYCNLFIGEIVVTGLSILIIFICVALDMSLIATLIVSAAIPAIAALIAFLALLNLTFMGADCGSWGRSWNWLTAREAVWDAVFLPASAAAIVWTCLLYIEMLRVGMSAYYGIPCVLVVLAAGIGAGIRIEWYSHNTGATRALIAASLIGEVTVLVLALIRFA